MPDDPRTDARSGQVQQQQERGREQPGHRGVPQAGEQQPAADDSQLKPPDTQFPADDTGAPTRDQRHRDAADAMSGAAPDG